MFLFCKKRTHLFCKKSIKRTKRQDKSNWRNQRGIYQASPLYLLLKIPRSRSMGVLEREEYSRGVMLEGELTIEAFWLVTPIGIMDGCGWDVARSWGGVELSLYIWWFSLRSLPKTKMYITGNQTSCSSCVFPGTVWKIFCCQLKS